MKEKNTEKAALKSMTREERNAYNRRNVLHTATMLFIEKGYHLTTVKELCTRCNISIGTFINLFECKENLMKDIVQFVLEAQFEKTEQLIADIPHDTILLYAAETTLQLYMAESKEHIRELYSVAYSLPHTTEIIQNTITQKLEVIFKEQMPELKTRDFYMLEIASGGVMRGFLTKPCDMMFSMEDKVQSFLTTTLRIFLVPDEKIAEAIEFVSRFDFKTIADEAIAEMFEKIKNRI